MDASRFDFRTDAPAAYTRVDRMGMPAVATAVISAGQKAAYNDDDPSDDATQTGAMNKWVAEIATNLLGLHQALRDDLVGAGLTPCSAANPAAIADILACATQTVGPGGPTVLSLVVPDYVKVNVTQPAGFPNGRRLADPVIDVTLAVLLLDVSDSAGAAGTLAALPLNPPANDVPYLETFPYVAYPHVP